MNWKLILTIVFVMSALAVRLPLLGINVATAANAQEHDHEHDDHDHDEHVGENADHNDHDHANTASLAASWELLQEDRADIKTAVSDGNSSEIHDLGLRLESTAEGLAKHRAEVEEGQQERFDSYVNQLMTLSHDFHHSGEEGDLEESEKVATQVEGIMLLLAAVMPASSS